MLCLRILCSFLGHFLRVLRFLVAASRSLDVLGEEPAVKGIGDRLLIDRLFLSGGDRLRINHLFVARSGASLGQARVSSPFESAPGGGKSKGTLKRAEMLEVNDHTKVLFLAYSFPLPSIREIVGPG